jgi:hypothetical protein
VRWILNGVELLVKLSLQAGIAPCHACVSFRFLEVATPPFGLRGVDPWPACSCMQAEACSPQLMEFEGSLPIWGRQTHRQGTGFEMQIGNSATHFYVVSSVWDLTHTAQSKATQQESKPNQKSKTHTRVVKQAKTTSVEGRARPCIGVQPEACVTMYSPDRHRDALPWQRVTLSSRSAPEMKAARERPGPPACTAWSA